LVRVNVNARRRTMRWRVALAAIATLALAAGITAVAAKSTGGPAANSEQVIRLVTHNDASGYLDLGEPYLSIGDQIPFSNDLYRDGSWMGEDGGWCVVTRLTGNSGPRGHGPLAPTYECVGTNSLPDGQLTAQGLVTYGPHEEVKTDPYFFAITGGTGSYRGARGEVRIDEVSASEARLTFRIVVG
jgi:allene oxide cyclase-like protein